MQESAAARAPHEGLLRMAFRRPGAKDDTVPSKTTYLTRPLPAPPHGRKPYARAEYDPPLSSDLRTGPAKPPKRPSGIFGITR